MRRLLFLLLFFLLLPAACSFLNYFVLLLFLLCDWLSKFVKVCSCCVPLISLVVVVLVADCEV